MNPIFTILRRNPNDSLTEVAVAKNQEQAAKLVRAMKKLWPGSAYEIRIEQKASEFVH